MAAEDKLTVNRKYISDNWESLFKLYNGKFIVVVDKKVVQPFDTYEAAATYGIENYGLEGDFLVHYMADEEPINFVLSAAL